MISKASALWSCSSKDTLLINAAMTANLDEGIESIWMKVKASLRKIQVS